MPSLSALSRVEPSLPAQQTTQAAATLEEYSGKFTQRLQKIMNCVPGSPDMFKIRYNRSSRHTRHYRCSTYYVNRGGSFTVEKCATI